MTLNSSKNLPLLNKNDSPVSNDLLQLKQNFDRTTNSTEAREAFRRNHDFMLLNDSGTKVTVRVTTVDVEQILPSLEKLGFEVIGKAPELHFLEGTIPIDSLEELASLTSAGLMGVMPIYAPQTNVGLVTSQADFVHESDRVRNSLPAGFDGTGIEIGVLSDSYNNLGGAGADIASGDLPTGIDVLQDLSSGGSDEGRAMLQLVHDIAPGADLSFATAFGGESNFANNIINLANAGADIIVDDILYFAEPFFQDGIVAQTVNSVVNNGAAYFSSAGNLGNIAYESTAINFVPFSGFPGQSLLYDFNPGSGVDIAQRITIASGDSINLSFQWDDPFYTTNGVDTDLDIYLFDSVGNLVASSEDANLSNQTPSEILSFTNNTSNTNFDVVINLFSGLQPGRVKYVPFFGSKISDPNLIYQEYATNSPTIYGHAAATNASAVAAVPYFDQDNPEPFTSLGPTTILFNANGTRRATPEIRQKPDIAAIDNTDTTFFVAGNDIDGNGFPNFPGTSAAAPHAAAVAALIKQANPSFTPAQIYNRLESTAKDISAPGFDNLTGFGLINAYDAVFGSVVPAALDFSDNFEAGDLSLAYETNTNGAGRIQVTGVGNPIGTKHLILDSSRNGFFSLNEVILNVDTIGFSDVNLSFAQKEFDDEDDVMPATFTGSVNADGVALSVDGTNWFRLTSLTGSASTNNYQTNTFNLSNFATTNGLTLGSDVRIKFQQFDNFPISSDGFAFDNISVTGTAGSGQNLIGDSGNNSLTGGAGDDTISGLAGRDTLKGLDGDDSIIGGGGRDTLNGGAGQDTLKGSIGNDRLNGGNDADSLIGAGGNDTLNGGAGRDTLKGGAGSDRLNGGNNADSLIGAGGNDTLNGGAGRDTLKGGAGNDFLTGGKNVDLLFGNSGIDTFVIKRVTASDRIVIRDYTDNIDVLGLADGLTFADLTIINNQGNTATLIRETSTNSTLAVLSGIDSTVTNIDNDDFVLI